MAGAYENVMNWKPSSYSFRIKLYIKLYNVVLIIIGE